MFFWAEPHILTALFFFSTVPRFFANRPHHSILSRTFNTFIEISLIVQASSQLTMATVLPPPSKRQKRANLERTQIQQDVSAVAAGPAGSFKARFLDSEGKQMADVIEVPLADASEKNLSLLLNTLLARVCFTFLRENSKRAFCLANELNN